MRDSKRTHRMKKMFYQTSLLFYFLIFFSLVSSVPVFAQNLTIDSLLRNINNYSTKKQPDTTLAKLQHNLATEYALIENKQLAIQYDLEALKYAGDYKPLLFSIHNSLGSYYLDIDNFVESLTEFKTALKIAIELDDQIKIGIVHFNLSTHYDRTSNDSLSYVHLQTAYDLMIEAGDTLKTIYLLNSLGTYEVEHKQLSKALMRFQEALDLSLESGDVTLMSNSYNNFANYYLIIKDTNTALDFLKKSYAIDKVSGTSENTAIVTYNIAAMYKITNKIDSALTYIELAKINAIKSNQIYLLKPVYNKLFEVYYEMGRYDSLMVIFSDFQNISDSLFTRENLKKYSETQNEIELLSAQQKNALLKLNEESSNQRFIYLSVVTGLLLLILIGSLFAVKRFKSQKEIAELLHQKSKIQNTKIETQQEELIHQNSKLEQNALYKDRIMSLLAHDLRTPFASIHSLNHLVKASGEMNEKQLSFMETSDKVISGGLDLISDILHIYKLEHIDDFDFEILNITQLLNNSAEKIRPITLIKQQELILDYENNIEFKMNREMLQSAIDNLLSNASKYSQDGKTITIKMFKKADTLTIKITDQGAGFSSDEQKIIFDRFNKFTRTNIRNEPSTGLGLFLVKGFVEKLNGTITLESEHGKGSIFTLIFES